jgi:multiple sugar transport system permease protein
MSEAKVATSGKVIATHQARARKIWPWFILFRWLSMAAVLTLALLPIVYLFSTSLKTRDEILNGSFWPESLYWDNWPDAFDTVDLPLFMRNSLTVGALSALLTLLIAVPASYSMVRFATGGKALNSIVLGSYIAPPIVALLPLFYLLKRIHGIDTLWGLALVHGLASVPIAVWLLDSFVRTLPREIEEAARIDGAGQLHILLRIVVPLIAPGIVTTGIICFILSYNEFLFALVMTYQPATQTLPVGIALFQGDRLVNYGQMSAASLAGMLPVYGVALVFQRYLIGGRTSGAVK